jgi:hypothetical protein
VRALLLAAWAGAGAGAGVVDIIKCERAGRGRSLVQAAAGRVFVLRPTSPLHTHTLHAARAAFMTLDLCEAEQSALAREHVLTARLYTDDPHSHAGPRSISPFAPCCASRLPVVYDAARLTRDSVVWDLGCGDGRVLHDAAARYGCRCVGVEIDATCLRRCASRAKSRGPVVENLCRWHLADVTAAPEGVLGRDDALAPGTPAPTVVIVFVTGHGLRAISPWLKREWERAPRPFTIVTCVESLDACVDYRDGVSFDDFDPRAANPDGWEVYRDETHAKYGVFVVPPRCVSVEAWRASRPTPRACGPGSVAADAEPVAVVRNVLTDAECAALHLFAASTGFEGPHRTRTEDEEEEERERMERGEARGGGGSLRGEGAEDDGEEGEEGDDDDDDDDADEEEQLAMTLSEAILNADRGSPSSQTSADGTWAAVEDAYHAMPSHRVMHLHANAEIDNRAPGLRAKLLRALHRADEGDARDRPGGDARRAPRECVVESGGGWGLLRGRHAYVRSIEYHAYSQGGSVSDPTHRDAGSTLTMSVLLDREDAGGGGVLFTADGAGVRTTVEGLRRGDAVVFPSERVHGVTPLVSEDARRSSVVLEVWEGGVTSHNRQR